MILSIRSIDVTKIHFNPRQYGFNTNNSSLVILVLLQNIEYDNHTIYFA